MLKLSFLRWQLLFCCLFVAWEALLWVHLSLTTRATKGTSTITTRTTTTTHSWISQQSTHRVFPFWLKRNVSIPSDWNAGGLLVDSLQGLAYENKYYDTSVQQSQQQSLHNTPPLQLQLLSNANFNEKQTFSATWWQSVKRFQHTPVHKIRYCEDATFQATLHQGHLRDYRLTTDWTDFAVEHLSKWWKITKYDKDHAKPAFVAYRRMMRNLIHYTLRVLAPPLHLQTSTKTNTAPLLNVTQQTLATIAYLPIKSKKRPTLATRLTIVNVAATMAALLQQDFGRIILFGDVEDYDYTINNIWSQVIHLLQMAVDPRNITTLHPEHILQNQPPPRTVVNTTTTSTLSYSDTVYIRNSQVQFIAAPTRKYHKIYGQQKMVPRQAVIDMHQALFGTTKKANKASTQTGANVELHSKIWLGAKGGRKKWKYVYLTEPDIILLTKRQFILQVQPYLDQGLIFTPHRLQPVPHEYDFRFDMEPPTNPRPDDYVPAIANWTVVNPLSPSSDACCDSGLSIPPKRLGEGCDAKWYQCGFGNGGNASEVRRTALERWKRLRPYRLVQCIDGTRIVMLTASESGRLCVPRNVKHQGPCPTVPVHGLALDINFDDWK